MLLPALPEMIQNRRAADRLADLVYDEMEAQRDNPDRLALLFSAVSAIHAAAPDWFMAEEYLDAIWARITEIWPDLTPAPFGPENRRDWDADSDIVLLRRVGLSQTDALSDADVHAEVLLYLYKRRRERAQEPGVGQYELQRMLGCTTPE